MSKDMWIAVHEHAVEAFAAGEMEGQEFKSEMKYLGFTPAEIREEYFSIVKDMDPGQAVIAMCEWFDLDYADALCGAVEALPKVWQDKFDDEYTKTKLPEGLTR